MESSAEDFAVLASKLKYTSNYWKEILQYEGGKLNNCLNKINNINVIETKNIHSLGLNKVILR